MTSAGATSLVTGLSRHHSSFLQDPRSRPRPASPPRLPPHPRRHLGPPDRGHGLPGRSPLPPGHHRDQQRQDRAQATRPTGGHHQPQRPPNHCSAPAHPDRSRNPQIPQALRTLRRQESGTASSDATNPELITHPTIRKLINLIRNTFLATPPRMCPTGALKPRYQTTERVRCVAWSTSLLEPSASHEIRISTSSAGHSSNAQ